MGQLVSQHGRLFYFNCPLGLDVLILNKFSGTEEISHLFQFELELASEDGTIQTEDLLGKNVTCGVRHRDGVTFRYFNGQVSKFLPTRQEGRLYYYAAEVVPWVWFLSLSNECQIYQDKTVPQVIDATFAKFGFHGYDTSGITGEHKPWENCCQYMESSWDFVARLMEMEGIYYYFTHEDGKHTLMLVDNMAALLPCPYQSSIRYEHQLGPGEYRTEDTIFRADMHKVVKPNVYENNDYNFKIPTNKLKDWQKVPRDTGLSINVSRRFYPANVELPGEPQDYAKLRIEEQEHDHTVSNGTSNARAMLPGFRFDMTDHDRPEQNINYLIVKVTHTAQEGTLLPGMDKQEASYMNDFAIHPSSIVFRPNLKTEEPQITSMQTAFVVGPPGEEIYTDEYGRVRVKFLWDLTPGDDNGASSCWMRVMQPWAGPMYGQIWIPRVGMEVVVQFLNGDPDRPVITGCVYHAKNMPPYPLPAKKEWTGIKTRSTKGGTEDNYNEIRLQDNIGDELFRMQAEKNFHLFVKNDRCELVLNDRFLEVDNDKHEKIKNDKYTTVKGDFQEQVEGDVSVKVGGDASLSIDGDQTEEVDGDKHSTVEGDFAEDIEGDTSIQNEGDYDQKIGGDGKITVDGDLDIKANGDLVIEAAGDFVIKCGGSFIKFSNGIVTIQGTKVLINCGGSADPADEADPDDPDSPEDFDNPEVTSPDDSMSNEGSDDDSDDDTSEISDGGGADDSSDDSSDDDSDDDSSDDGEDDDDSDDDDSGDDTADDDDDDDDSPETTSDPNSPANLLANNPWVAQGTGILQQGATQIQSVAQQAAGTVQSVVQQAQSVEQQAAGQIQSAVQQAASPTDSETDDDDTDDDDVVSGTPSDNPGNPSNDQGVA